MNTEVNAGAQAPEKGYYRERNVLGSMTGRVVWREIGHLLPGSARGFTWLFVRDDADDRRDYRFHSINKAIGGLDNQSCMGV